MVCLGMGPDLILLEETSLESQTTRGDGWKGRRLRKGGGKGLTGTCNTV